MTRARPPATGPKRACAAAPALALALVLALAGCTAAVPPARPPQALPPVAAPTLTAPAPRPPSERVVPPTRPAPAPEPGFRAPQVLRAPGLEGVIEQGADQLQQQFGPARLDVREGDMRKLQFSGEACVLDVFLYPQRAGGEPVATYVEARRASDGQDVDRAACVAALRKPR